MTDTRFKQVENAAQKVGLDPERLRASIERLGDRGVFWPSASSLTQAETEFLDQYSGTTPDPEALLDAQLETAIAETRQFDEALDVAQVATMLKVGTSRVRQLITEGRLYALPASAGRGNPRLFPAWQFVGDRPIPHVGEVAAALPAPTHPLEVEAFFKNARVEDENSDLTMTVEKWLLTGGPVEPVIALAESLAYGL